MRDMDNPIAAIVFSITYQSCVSPLRLVPYPSRYSSRSYSPIASRLPIVLFVPCSHRLSPHPFASPLPIPVVSYRPLPTPVPIQRKNRAWENGASSPYRQMMIEKPPPPPTRQGRTTRHPTRRNRPRRTNKTPRRNYTTDETRKKKTKREHEPHPTRHPSIRHTA